MANGYDRILAVLQAQAEAEAKRPTTLDKLNALFGNISNVAKDLQDQNKSRLEQKKTALETQKLQKELNPPTMASIYGMDQPEDNTAEILRIRDENKRKMAEAQARVAGVQDVESAQAPELIPEPQNSREMFTKKAIEKLGYNPFETNLSQAKELSDIQYKQALMSGGIKRPKELTPVIATKENELATNGLIKSGEATTLGDIERLAQLNRTNIISNYQNTRQEDRQQFSAEQQARSFDQKEQAEQRSNRKKQLDEITDAEEGFNAYKEALSKVPEGMAGGAQTLVSKTGIGYPEAATVDRAKNALAVTLYRALTGDTRLSDADAASRATPLLASAYQDQGQRDKLNQFIEQRLQERKQRIQSGISGVMQLPGRNEIFNSMDKNLTSQEQPISVRSEQEAMALPKGSRFILNGRTGTVK